jgi:hypothetical protein
MPTSATSSSPPGPGFITDALIELLRERDDSGLPRFVRLFEALVEHARGDENYPEARRILDDLRAGRPVAPTDITVIFPRRRRRR